MMKAISWAAMAVLVLVGCDRRELAVMCAARGDPSADLQLVAHAADGRAATLDTADGRTTITRRTLDTPLLPDLWRNAQFTIRALSPSEVAPCGLPSISSVTLIYDDGSVTHHRTTCEGNALDRLTGQIFEASDVARPGSDPVEEPLSAALLDPSEACARAL